MNLIIRTTLCSKVVLGILLDMHTMGRWVLILLISVAIKQAIFIFIIPAWQVPDEPAHVAYVQSLVEQGHLPVFSDQGMDMSREMFISMTAIEDANPLRIGRHYPPGFLSVPHSGNRHLVDDDAPVRNLAARNSPAYYLYASLGYIATYQQDLETRLLAMRIVTSLLLLVTIWLAVRLAVNLGQPRWSALTIGAVVGWHPAMSAIFAGVNPDAALTLVSTWGFYLMLSPMTGSMKKRLLMLALSVGLAASIKPAGWFLIAPAILWLFYSYRVLDRARWWKLALLGTAIIAVVGGGWLATQSWRSSSRVLAIAPNESLGLSPKVILNNDIFERPAIAFRTWWGHLGWSGVSGYTFEWVYAGALIITLLAGIGSVVWLIRRARHNDHWRTIIIAAVGILSLEGLYQYLYWQAGLREGMTHFPVHGRYYLPLIVPLALWLAVGLRQCLPSRARWTASVALIGFSGAATIALIFRAWSLYRFERLVGW